MSSDKSTNFNIKGESMENNYNYQYIDVFKNPNKLPINQIHIERSWRELKKSLPDIANFNFLEKSPKDIEEAYFVEKSEIIPALDQRWVPPGILDKFEPYSFLQEDENVSFLTKNLLFLEGLDYLLKCNFHQFWCVILFEPSAAICLRSFLLNPILPFYSRYMESDYKEICRAVFNKYLLVYEKLVTFKKSEIEYMSELYGLSKLIDRRLLNLPIVITLAVLYKDVNLPFVNKIVDLYLNNTNDVAFLVKEVETCIDQNRITLEMIGGYICGFDKSAIIVPIAVPERPAVFSLSWVYIIADYLLATLMTSNALFRFYKPAVEIALSNNFPFRLPFMYVSIFRELYELLNDREETQTKSELFRLVLDVMNMGRSEFIELFHTFVSHCLDEALTNMGNSSKQEPIVENYLKLLTTALEDEYFICDYNAIYNVASQNEMFESCCEIDTTRTEFIVSCINKLPRHKKLEELSQVKRDSIVNLFRNFVPPEQEKTEEFEPQAGPSMTSTSNSKDSKEVDEQIQSILDMFPHLGDGFVYQCLDVYDFKTEDVINAILENNLPPHLVEIPFDTIRIPPEPEPEKPILAYKGKKPQYDDALKLLNDKKEKEEIKNLVLEGVHYNYENVYDDEYDDRDEDDVVPVPDASDNKEMEIFNPNRKNAPRESESEDEPSEDEAGSSQERNRLNFCQDPAVLRARREAQYRAKRGGGGNSGHSSNAQPKGDVVGKPKGQGQDKNTLVNRQKKNVNKSSRANHNRKGGAQFKRNRGMIPS